MKTAARWTAIIALFAIPFLPLYVPGEMFFPFITGKNFAFRILVEFAFAGWIFLALTDKRYRPRFSWILASFGGLVLWMLVANAFGVNPHKGFWSNFERMDGWVTLVHVFLLFVVAGSVLTVERLWRRWWLFFVSVAAAVCAYGLVQLMGAAEIAQGGVRLTASLGNAIYLAVYVMFSMVLAAWLMASSKGWQRHALMAFMALAAVVLFYTGSRGPMLGLAVGVIFAAMVWLFLALRSKREVATVTGIKVTVGALILLVVAAGSLFLIRDAAFVKADPTLSRIASVFSLNKELQVRSIVWGMALEGAKEDPLTGWGQEGFNQVFNKYYDPALYEQESWFDRAHNMYLDWLIAGGIPALCFFVALLALTTVTLLRMPGASRAERVLLAGAVVAYAVQALVVFDNLFSCVPLVMLFAMAHTASSRTISKVEALPELKNEGMMNVAAAGLAAAAVLLAWTVNVPGIRAAHDLVYAISPSPKGAEENLKLFKRSLADGSFGSQEIREQLVMFSSTAAKDDKVPEKMRLALLNLSLSEIAKEVQASPNDARLRVQYAGAYDALGDIEGSLAQIDAAIALSPKKQALHISRGFKLWDLGRHEEAKEAFFHAYDLDRSFDQVAISAASGLMLSGDVVEGKALLLEAVGTTTLNSESLFYTYYQTKQWDDLIGVAQARVKAEAGSAESRYRLAQAFAAAGRFETARQEIVQTMAEHPESKAEGEALLKRMFPAQ